jgi:hypothetical protein
MTRGKSMARKRQIKGEAKRAKIFGPEYAGSILGCFTDFAENTPDEFIPYMEHCGMEAEVIAAAGDDLSTIILAHYRIKPGQYDIDRAARDLATWPRIAAYIVEVQMERDAGKQQPSEISN